MGYSRFGYCADGNSHARFVSDYCYCQKSSCFFLNRILFTANISALYQAIYFLIVLEFMTQITLTTNQLRWRYLAVTSFAFGIVTFWVFHHVSQFCMRIATTVGWSYLWCITALHNCHSLAPKTCEHCENISKDRWK